MLGLGANIVHPLNESFKESVVSDNLVLRHNYKLNPVQPLSDGAADINADAAANEYIDVGTIAISTGNVSMCAWVYMTAFVNYGAIFANREGGDENLGIELRCGSNNFQINYDHGGSSVQSNSSTKNINQWYHVCGVWDRSETQYLYVDGVLEDSDSINATDVTHTTVAKIGQYGSTEIRGYVCNVGYWNRILSQTEIKSIMWKNYSGLTSSETTSLVSWYNLDEETATDGTAGSGGVKDHHGTNHGTLS